MAVKTPSTVAIHNLGSLTLHIAYFLDVDCGDIWNSSIPNVVSVWANKRDEAANGSGAGIACNFTASSAVINFQCEANGTADCFVLSGHGNL